MNWAFFTFSWNGHSCEILAFNNVKIKEGSYAEILRVSMIKQIKYRPDTLVLRGISCTFEEGHNIGIVGRTGSGKTTIIGALFRPVEPARGKI